jgi:AraC-like DNA-binding protein
MLTAQTRVLQALAASRPREAVLTYVTVDRHANRAEISEALGLPYAEVRRVFNEITGVRLRYRRVAKPHPVLVQPVRMSPKEVTRAALALQEAERSGTISTAALQAERQRIISAIDRNAKANGHTIM